MTESQNAIFKGRAPEDTEFDHPPGAGLARALATALTNSGWQTDEIDNWRDSGWLVRCCRGASDLDVVLAATVEQDEWFLQIAPHRKDKDEGAGRVDLGAFDVLLKKRTPYLIEVNFFT